MNPFSLYSDQIRKRIMKTFDEREVIAIILKKFLKQEVNKDLVTVRDTVLSVKVSGALKQELRLRSKEIQHLLQGAGITVTKIR